MPRSYPLSAFLIALLLCLATSALAQNPGVEGKPFSDLIVFSGSLSDTGNAAAVEGDFPDPFFHNRTTNGLAAIDILAAQLQLSSAPSLHLVGGQGGNNFAVLHANAYGDLPIDLPAQVGAYLDKYNGEADPDALYFIFIGANDIVSATIAQEESESQAFLWNAIYSVESAFRNLHAAGAQTFYAPNNVNIGIAPIAIQFGVSERATQLTIQFNDMWEQKLQQLEQELDIEIYRFDFFRQIEDLMNVGGTLGFTDVTRSCIELMESGECDLSRFAFINELLPVARVHELFGNALATSLVQQMNARSESPRRRRGARARSYSHIQSPGMQY